MELTLIRNPEPTKDYTAGKLFIDDQFAFFTLEDEVREVFGKPVKAWKVYGETAIPRGRYRVILTKSPRFGRLLPEVLGVPGFQAIRIHAGNTAKNTEGCILVGNADGNSKDSWLGNSRAAENALVATLNPVLRIGQQVWLTVK
jgi:hypothetical protein